MAKHIAFPATADQIERTLGVTEEDREIVHRLLMELGEYSSPLCGEVSADRAAKKQG